MREKLISFLFKKYLIDGGKLIRVKQYSILHLLGLILIGKPYNPIVTFIDIDFFKHPKF